MDDARSLFRKAAVACEERTGVLLPAKGSRNRSLSERRIAFASCTGDGRIGGSDLSMIVGQQSAIPSSHPADEREAMVRPGVMIEGTRTNEPSRDIVGSLLRTAARSRDLDLHGILWRTPVAPANCRRFATARRSAVRLLPTLRPRDHVRVTRRLRYSSIGPAAKSRAKSQIVSVVALVLIGAPCRRGAKPVADQAPRTQGCKRRTRSTQRDAASTRS